MKRLTKIGFSTAGVVLAGGGLLFAGIGGGTLGNITCSGDALRCLGGECSIPIAVTSCGVASAGNYGALEVQKEFSVCKPSKMVWKLDKTYQFPTDGIAFKTDSPDFGPAEDADKKPWKFTLRNKHNRLGQFEYAITVQKSDGSPCAHVDPFVYNE